MSTSQVVEERHRCAVIVEGLALLELRARGADPSASIAQDVVLRGAARAIVSGLSPDELGFDEAVKAESRRAVDELLSRVRVRAARPQS